MTREPATRLTDWDSVEPVMELLAAKVLATSVLIAAATLTARHWGETVGGMFAGLPLTSGPVSLALAVERGPDTGAGDSRARP